MILKISQLALQKITNISKNHNNLPILIGVKGGGCNGLKYYIEPLEDKPNKLDEKITNLHDSPQIYVCGKSVLHIIGSELVWKQDIMGERFDFVNPNVQSTCGCGETFSIK
tara:strand:- start:86 stop:418 length:333 start_codon:yes stop_codon:yes gene_type:complete